MWSSFSKVLLSLHKKHIVRICLWSNFRKASQAHSTPGLLWCYSPINIYPCVGKAGLLDSINQLQSAALLDPYQLSYINVQAIAALCLLFFFFSQCSFMILSHHWHHRIMENHSRCKSFWHLRTLCWCLLSFSQYVFSLSVSKWHAGM